MPGCQMLQLLLLHHLFPWAASQHLCCQTRLPWTLLWTLKYRLNAVTQKLFDTDVRNETMMGKLWWLLLSSPAESDCNH